MTDNQAEKLMQRIRDNIDSDGAVLTELHNAFEAAYIEGGNAARKMIIADAKRGIIETS